jgi:hypothetical protein
VDGAFVSAIEQLAQGDVPPVEWHVLWLEYLRVVQGRPDGRALTTGLANRFLADVASAVRLREAQRPAFRSSAALAVLERGLVEEEFFFCNAFVDIYVSQVRAALRRSTFVGSTLHFARACLSDLPAV